VGWCRHDLGWGHLQPDGPDSWDEAYLEKWKTRILANREQGVETLPVLAYTAVWAARTRAWSFTIGRKRYDVQAFTGGDPKKREAVETDLDTGDTREKTFHAGRVPPESVKHWEAYVERVVTELRKAPYDVEYFQIWNEANDRFTGFWAGGMDEYMTTIHLPAARIIRQHGGKVVYGGYPCNGSMPHFLAVLDRHQAWDSLDVLDMHYFGIGAWDHAYKRMEADGRNLAIWQTEVGFTRSREWVPNNYPRFFSWALTHDWRPDRYRIFQFANWTPDDPKSYGYDKCFLHGKKLSFHGRAFMTLAGLVDMPDVHAQAGVRTTPDMGLTLDGKQPSMEAFAGKGRLVVALHVPRTMEVPGDAVALTVPIPAQRVRRAVRVGIYGSETPLVVAADGEAATVQVPLIDTDDTEKTDQATCKTRTSYVRFDLAE
jgi:hypothetical protein